MNKLRQKATYMVGLGYLTLAAALPVYAGAKATSPIENPTGIGSFGELIQFIINLLLGLIGFVAIIYLIWSGFKYVTAGGDAKKAGEAKEGITHAIIGLAVAFIGYLLVQFVYQALQVDEDISSQVFKP